MLSAFCNFSPQMVFVSSKTAFNTFCIRVGVVLHWFSLTPINFFTFSRFWNRIFRCNIWLALIYFWCFNSPIIIFLVLDWTCRKFDCAKKEATSNNEPSIVLHRHKTVSHHIWQGWRTTAGGEEYAFIKRQNFCRVEKKGWVGEKFAGIKKRLYRRW